MFAEGPLTGLSEQSAGWLAGPLQSFRVCVLLCSMCSEAKMAVATNLTDSIFHNFSLFKEVILLADIFNIYVII